MRSRCFASLLSLSLLCIAAGSARAEDAPKGPVDLGAASLARSADRVAAMIKEVPVQLAKEVRATPIDQLSVYGGQASACYEKLTPAMEVLVLQSMLLAVDRLVSEPGFDGLGPVRQRVQDVFAVAPADLAKLHRDGLAWSEVILGLSIAHVTGKKGEDLIAQAREGKTWPDIAVGAGLQRDRMGPLMKQLFRP